MFFKIIIFNNNYYYIIYHLISNYLFSCFSFNNILIARKIYTLYYSTL